MSAVGKTRHFQVAVRSLEAHFLYVKPHRIGLVAQTLTDLATSAGRGHV